MKFRKKPIVIEAIQFTGDNLFDCLRFMREPEHVVNNLELHATDSPIIRTLEGEMSTSPGDWIIRGVKGEYYPCKPDIFEATYDDATEKEATEEDARLRTRNALLQLAFENAAHNRDANEACQATSAYIALVDLECRAAFMRDPPRPVGLDSGASLLDEDRGKSDARSPTPGDTDAGGGGGFGRVQAFVSFRDRNGL